MTSPQSAIISDDDIISFLKSTSFFKNLKVDDLRPLISRFETIFISSGEMLIQEEEQGDCLYLAVAGRLRAIKSKEHTKILSEIGRGDIIGELALITEQPRAATVIAIRDSIVLKLSKKSFQEYIQNNPQLLLPIVNAAITRILNPKPAGISDIVTIALIPSATNKYFNEFGETFTKELAKKGTILHLTRSKLESSLKQANILFNPENITNNTNLIYWLNEQETKYQYIIYEADQDNSEWTKQCIRQADRILLIADARENPQLNAIEEAIFAKPSIMQKKISLVLLNTHSSFPATLSWLTGRSVNEHYQIRYPDIADIQRFTRILTGQAICLVLGGGGARALAHVGVYKAFKELNIPIDIIGGTSFGAVVGAFIASGEDLDVIIAKMKKYIVNNKKLFRYTLPLLAVSSGSALTDIIKTSMGEDTLIEDLWKTYFCISCNLTHGRMQLIQNGLLWKGVRASVAIPAFFPPISNEQQDLFIDGGVVNNLPVDVMRQFSNGGKIIAASTSVASPLQANIPDGVISGWQVLAKRFTKNPERFPNIAEIILKSLGIASHQHESEMKKQADCMIEIEARKKLFDFHAIDELIELGYQTAMKKLQEL